MSRLRVGSYLHKPRDTVADQRSRQNLICIFVFQLTHRKSVSNCDHFLRRTSNSSSPASTCSDEITKTAIRSEVARHTPGQHLFLIRPPCGQSRMLRVEHGTQFKSYS